MCLFSSPACFLRHTRHGGQEGAAVQRFRSGCNLAEEATFISMVEIKEHRKQAGYRGGHHTRHMIAIYSALMWLQSTMATVFSSMTKSDRIFCLVASPPHCFVLWIFFFKTMAVFRLNQNWLLDCCVVGDICVEKRH